MKKILLFIPLIALAITACSKDDGKSVVDCFGESLFVDVHHTASAENSRTINFNVTYSGSHTLNNSITWNFGDGTSQTATGTAISHTYAQHGNYTAKANVSINKDSESCSYSVNESVSIAQQ
jgi:hypothetical protein